jgi:nucleoid-associated protein YgaU
MVLLLAWLAALAAVLAGAHAVGHGSLAAPPATPSQWPVWLADRTPADASMAVLRLLVVALAAYLLLATALAMVADPVLPTPAFVRTLVGAALLTTLVLASAPSRSGRDVARSTGLIATSSDEAPVLRRLDVEVEAAPPPVAAATWTIRPGDHLWRVAEETMGTDAPLERVERYWRTLVEHNRARLADPTNPDLVFAGQVFELPSLPSGA